MTSYPFARPLGKGSFSARGHLLKILLSQFYAGSRRQQKFCTISFKSNKPDFVPFLVSIHKHGKDCPFGSNHPLPGSHRTAGIHNKENKVTDLFLPDLFSEIGFMNYYRISVLFPCKLIRSSCPSNVASKARSVGFFVRNCTLYIPALSGTGKCFNCALPDPFRLALRNSGFNCFI